MSLLSISFFGWNFKLPFGFCFHIPSCHPTLSAYQKFQFLSIVKMFPVASQVALVVKNPSDNARNIRDRIDVWVGKNPWRRAWQPTPIFWPGETHGQRRLAGYSPQGRKESDTILHACTVHRMQYGSKFIISFGIWTFRSLSTIWWKDSPFPVDLS